MSGSLGGSAREFSLAKQSEAANARQTAAFFLATGIDLDAAMAAPCEQRRTILRRLDRLLERERQKGLSRHWAYDLNRHIALKQARDRIGRPDGAPQTTRRGQPKQKRRPKAPQRRHAKSNAGGWLP